MNGPQAAGVRRAAVALLAVALLFEAVLLLGWLRPLALWDHRVNPPDGAPMVTLLGRTTAGMLRFALPSVALIGLQLVALAAARSSGRWGAAIAVGASVLFALTLLPVFPGGTQDIFHNIADARLLWLYGENPTLVPPAAYPEDAFYRHLFGYNDLTSVYGPLWYVIAGLPALLAGDGLVANVVGQKALLAAALIGLALLAGWGAPPARRAQAVVLVGWSPLLLWEFAVNAHNDALMVVGLAAAVLAARGRWAAWSLPLLALSALVKYTSVLLGPPLLLWLLWRRRLPLRVVLLSLASAALLSLLAYLPFWAGADTLRALDRPGMTFILSPATLLQGALAQRWPPARADRVAYAVTGLAFAAVYVGTLARVRERTASLSSVSFDAAFWYLLLASWWFWPWYISWLAPLAAWTHHPGQRWAFLALTAAGLLSYVYWWYDPLVGTRAWFGWYGALVAGMFALPALLRLVKRTPSLSESEPDGA